MIKILQWSLKPHGSAWIARQAFLYLEEEFFVVANSDVLSSLDQETLAKILQSDFLQVKQSVVIVCWCQPKFSYYKLSLEIDCEIFSKISLRLGKAI